jgi:hypothetical protein
MSHLMETIRHALGLAPRGLPPMSDEQSAIARQQDQIRGRLKKRQDAIDLSQRSVDIQVDVLRRDKANERRRARQ